MSRESPGDVRAGAGSDIRNVGRIARAAPTLRELTVERLREAILTGLLKPGERLVQQDLCARTGVSRTCVREALQRLETEGLVERADDKGQVVASISLGEAREIYEVRAALEPAMARLFVARAGARNLANLRAALVRIEKSVATGELGHYVHELAEFYSVMLGGAGNEIARRFLGTLDARIAYLRRVTAERADPDRRQGTAKLLTEIVKAADAHDADAMAAHCAEMVRRSEQFALAILSEMEQEAGARQEEERQRRGRARGG